MTVEGAIAYNLGRAIFATAALVGVAMFAIFALSIIVIIETLKKKARERKHDGKQIRRHASNPVADRVRVDSDSVSVHDSVSVSNSTSD